ncbi:AAA family ATPase [Streptomyces cinnamoneus]|uniref:AAA family ATPase n=1 Tax=Streptomyces cinnamoneus TaxID=53446 RepID=UPI001EFE3868|nr:LuxR family transcriptional regulator [Streptomyces cinnamoneus]
MTPIIERENESAALAELRTAAAAGNGRVALLNGSVAAGKTELLVRFTDQAAADGALVLDATGTHTERSWPFALARKLFDSSPLPPEARDEAVRWMDEAAAQTSAEARMRVLPALAGTVLRPAADRLVVVAVDDAHLGDPLSLQFLLCLARRARRARVLIVLTASERLSQDQLGLLAELLRQPNCHRLRLKPLSAEGAGRMLTEYADGPADDGLAAALYERTGGNPLLVRALLEDSAAPATGDAGLPHALRPGEAYAGAVAEILHRCGAEVTALARGTAVLGEAAAPELLGRLLGLAPTAVEGGNRDLTLGGLFHDGRFRDATAAAAVLAGTPEQELAGLHHRAATLLRDDGASTYEVARHLVRTTATEPWAVPVLREAAEYALVDGDLRFARHCLALAQEVCPDGPGRVALKLRLASVLWRSKPAALGDHLTTLVPEMLRERLAPDELVVCVGYLVWAKRTDEAAGVLDTLERSATWSSQEERAALTTARQWLALISPAHRGTPHGTPPEVYAPAEPLGGAADIAHEHAVRAMTAALSHDTPDGAVAEATRVLQRYRLGDGYVMPLVFALWALTYAGKPDLALPWCERLLAECKDRYGPTWQALLTAVRGEIALRQGDLVKAERHASAALSLLPRRDWGGFVALPLSTLILAYTGMGRYDDAMELLNHTGPESELDTLPGLHFRRARGRWYLATGRFQAALGDFLTCGELMDAWGVDVPELAPWRVDASDAWLALGDRKKAVEMAEAQLLRAPDRERGNVLRALGCAETGRDRLERLEEAVQALENGGSRLQLAEVLGELGRGYQAVGDVNRARTLAHKAWHMARFCGAEPLCQGLMPGHAEPEGAPEEPEQEASTPRGTEALSEAEGRVAVLAAHGHTNREIAAMLYVTVSTVEQHLTRIYRKLRVQRRRDLPTTLSSRVGGLRVDL